MKVLFLNIYDDPAISGGGAETTLYHLTHGLMNHGIEPVIAATSDKPGLHQGELNGVRTWHAGIKNIYWPQPKVRPNPIKRMAWHVLDSYNIAMQHLLRKVLETEQPDVVSLHNLPGWSAASWATIADMGIPSVQVLHDSYLICPKATMYTERGNCKKQCATCHLLRLPHPRASNRLSAVVGVSNFILERHVKEGLFHEVPIRAVINNARDARALGVDVAAAPVTDQILRVGYIGRLDPSKGIELLFREFADARLNNVELHVAGTGNADYTQRLKEQWASDRIHFLGRVSQRDFYPNMDIVVVPSLWHDTFPGVVFESLAFGKPVIGSRRGGIPEMIQDGENGVLFEPDHPGELRAALQRLACNKVLRKKMDSAARLSARPFMDRNAWVKRYIDLYEQVISSSS